MQQKTVTGITPQQLASAQDALNQLRRGGRTPQPNTIVEAAGNADSPLHQHFIWDDAQAASAFRLLQAQDLLTPVE